MFLNIGRRVFFILLLFITVYLFRNYFKYNDHIEFFDADISNNCTLVDIINKNGVKKNPDKNFNNSSCSVLNYYDISNLCTQYITQFYNQSFLDKIKNIVNETTLEFINPTIDPLGFAIHLYCHNDFMKYHFDTNFTLGTRYSVIIPLYLNEFNDCFLHIKDNNKNEKCIKIDIGQGIVYNGDRVLHKVSKQSEQGQRITLVINLTTSSKSHLFGDILQKIRNYMFKEFTL